MALDELDGDLELTVGFRRGLGFDEAKAFVQGGDGRGNDRGGGGLRREGQGSSER